MDWNGFLNSVNESVDKKYQELEKKLKRKIRGYSDNQLINAYHSGNATSAGEEILEEEMRRRGLL